MTETTYEYAHVEGGVPIKMWTRGVPVDDKARAQLARAAQMPFVFKHVAAMPDVHVGIGATVGSVIPTKGAIIQLTRTMAAQHGEAGVRVNCVAPGMIYSPMVVVRGMSEEMREQRRQRSILKTEGTPWDVGAAVLFLASELGRWITGVTLPVDAGYSAGMTLPSPPRK